MIVLSSLPYILWVSVESLSESDRD